MIYNELLTITIGYRDINDGNIVAYAAHKETADILYRNAISQYLYAKIMYFITLLIQNILQFSFHLNFICYAELGLGSKQS